MSTENVPPPTETQSPPAGNRRKVIWIVAAVALLIVIVGSVALRSERRKAAVTAKIPTVPVDKVRRENLSQELVLDAEFRPYQDLDLYARVAGFVQEIKVDVGDRVVAGQRLATLEIPELAEEIERADALEKRSEEENKRAQLIYDEAHLLYERVVATDKAQPKLVAQQELDDTRAKERTAKATWDAARQAVRVAQAELKKLSRQLEYCRIVAPFSGVITKRFADEGDLVRGGTSPSAGAMPLVRLSQNERLRLVFPVSEAYVPRVKIGDPVEIRVEALHRTIPAKVSRFTREVQLSTRTMEVEAEVMNPELSLVPGMYASAVIKLDQHSNTLSVPLEAVSRQKQPTVMLVNTSGEVEQRAVKLGLETPTRLEILGGLIENELVLVGSHARFKTGQKVLPHLIELGRTE